MLIEGLFWTVVAFGSLLGLHHLTMKYGHVDDPNRDRDRGVQNDDPLKIMDRTLPGKVEIMRLRRAAREALGLEP